MKTPGIKGNANTTKLIQQLKKSNEQYPVLSKEQEQQLIEELKDNREELNKRLVLHNMRAVFSMAKKYVNSTYDFDGLVQDGMRGLTEAATLFDITKGNRFITYATWWIRKRMTENFYGRQIEVDKKTMSLSSKSTFSNDSNGSELENFVNQYMDPSCTQKTAAVCISASEQSKICSNLMKHITSDSSLSSQDKAIFVDIYQNQLRPREVSEKYNMSLHDVNVIKSKVLGICKDVLVNQYQIQSFDDLVEV